MEHLFDDHSFRELRGGLERLDDVISRRDADGHALPLVAIERLDRDRRADFFKRSDSCVLRFDDLAERNSYCRASQQRLGKFLIARCMYRNCVVLLLIAA